MQNNWDKSLKKISFVSVIILLPVSLGLLFMFDWRASLSILLGGFFAVLNFMGVIWGVESVMSLEKGKSKMIFMTFFRLLVLFSILLILLIFNVINIAAIAFGLSVVFMLILLEGLKRAREMRDA